MVAASTNEAEVHTPTASTYDRRRDLQSFDDTNAGVKGLVDAGITKVPRIFLHPPQPQNLAANTRFDFPLIDLRGFGDQKIAGRVREASETWGFFQVINHGIPLGLLEEMLKGIRKFHEQETEIKKKYYTRDFTRRVGFNSNFDLFASPAANWRDSIYCAVAPNPPSPEDLPQVCSNIMIEYSKEVMKFGRSLFELLSESLGLGSSCLLEMECAESLSLIGHYYPACPEPNLTLGTTRHSDNDFLTVLLQDNLGGLQVVHQDQWVDVPPVPGALVVNVGDLLQLITNDKFKSVEHRVLASSVGPRISVASFFGRNSGPGLKILAPIEELLSDENPAKYRATTSNEYTDYFRAKGLDGTSALLHFRL